jgi:hypothetical protein
MSKLIGRKPVEVNISSPKQNHIPFFNETTRLWETRNINGFITGSNTFFGDQTITGSLFVSGNVLSKNLQGVVIKNCGHYVPEECYEEFTEILIPFLE